MESWPLGVRYRVPICEYTFPSPTVVVVLPSPNGVGVTAETTTYLARGRSASSSIAESLILATCSPYGSMRWGPMPIPSAMSPSGLSDADWAIRRFGGKDIQALLSDLGV